MKMFLGGFTMRAALVGLSLTLVVTPLSAGAGIQMGPWRAWLDSRGGELPFGLEISTGTDGELAATIINADQRIEVPIVELDGRKLLLRFDDFDSEIRARLNDDGDELEGQWLKARRDGTVSEMRFHAESGDASRFKPTYSDVVMVPNVHMAGTWRVTLESEKEACVARLDVESEATFPIRVTGTIITPTGDLGYLEGDYSGKNYLRLSCFDGAHAFLLAGQVHPRGGWEPADGVWVDDASIEGYFWSGWSWPEDWRAVRDDDAKLPDGFTLATVAQARPDLSKLIYTDLDGRQVSLADLKNPDRPMVIELFGSWCPNCADAARGLAALAKEYRKAGLTVVGLAFERTDDLENSAARVRAYAKRHGVDYPLLIAGVASKESVAAAFPVIEQIRAYPTTVFIDAKGNVRAVYTGYSGPATGEDHAKLKADFNRVVRSMLDEVIK